MQCCLAQRSTQGDAIGQAVDLSPPKQSAVEPPLARQRACVTAGGVSEDLDLQSTEAISAGISAGRRERLGNFVQGLTQLGVCASLFEQGPNPGVQGLGVAAGLG